MIRLNIEPKLFLDPRFDALIASVGSRELAVGSLVYLWITAQHYYRHKARGIPTPVFMRLANAEKILEVDLAEKRGEFVYVRGSGDSFDWIKRLSESGIKGGVRSSAKREITKVKSKPPQATSSHSNPLTLTLTPTLALTHNTYMADSIESRLDRLYLRYPKRNGDQKKAAGIRRLAREIKTEDSLVEVSKAIENYKKHCEARSIVGTEFVKQFASWVSNWKEWITPTPHQTHTNHPSRKIITSVGVTEDTPDPEGVARIREIISGMQS